MPGPPGMFRVRGEQLVEAPVASPQRQASVPIVGLPSRSKSHWFGP